MGHWQVFPLDFGDSSFNWEVLARWFLAVGIGGSVIGILAGLVSLVRAARASDHLPPASSG